MNDDDQSIDCTCGHTYWDHEGEFDEPDGDTWCTICQCAEYNPDPWA